MNSSDNFQAASGFHEREGTCVNAAASWTAAVLRRFRFRCNANRARGLAHSKTSRVFGQFRHELISMGILLLALAGNVLHANPAGGSVVGGNVNATISGEGTSSVTIHQTAANAFINWQSFNIGTAETVNFNQPSASSVTWNQINDSNPSQILGSLNANGYVVLQNSAGFYIGGQASITAHGLIMTTASAPAPNFSSGGPWSFNTPPPTAQIINYGQIKITGGGSAYLIASDIENRNDPNIGVGTISAPGGKIGLYAGQTVLVSTSPDGRGLSAQVTLPEGSVDNEGKLIADGGSIAAQARMVNQNGLVQANSAQNVNGTVELVASDNLNIGASSQISATGDSTATTTASPGGFVVLNAGGSYSDASGSTISVSGNTYTDKNGKTAQGQGGIVEIFDPQAASTPIQSTVSGAFEYLLNPYDMNLSGNATGTSYDSDNNLDVNFNVSDLAAYSQIDLRALDNITLNTFWFLSDPGVDASLSLTAGNNITFEDSGYTANGILAGNNWSINLTAGAGFVPTAGQPKPASGSAGIYLNGGTYLETQDGDINLWAANEVQVGWPGAANGSQVNSGTGFITTRDGGNIGVKALYGDVNTGANTAGFDYQNTAPYTAPYYSVDNNLGGISTAAGGNVVIAAGGNVISYLPSGSDTGDAGTGAFGSQPGNVTITAGGSVYGHYVVANGTGTITAGQNVGAAAGNAFALSLINGGWGVNAPNGNIYLQEVRNPNGVFNGAGFASNKGKHLFNYGADASVDLTANGVYLIGSSVGVPRAPDSPSLPVIYPPILNIIAGSGGVTLLGNVILYPSLDQNLSITTTDGGNFDGVPNSVGAVPELLMSDSARKQWTTDGNFGDTDHGGLQNEPNESSPVLINISHSMEDLNLIVTKVADITVGGDMINCGFSGQNLQAGDVTSITVAGQIYYTSAYSFFTLAQAIPDIPVADLFPGMSISWDNIFALAVNPALIAGLIVPPGTTPDQLANYALIGSGASVFGAQLSSTSHLPVGNNPGFVYDPATGQLGFGGQMSSVVLAALTQPIAILHLVNGRAVIDNNPNDNSPGRTYGQVEYDTVSWAAPTAIQTLFTSSQGAPSPVNSQLGLRIGGPGAFDIHADSMSLGNSWGILSCGVSDSQGGFSRYANLASITPSGATLSITLAGDLNMLTSTIAALGGGDVNVTSTGGSMDLGAPALFNLQRNLGVGIFTTGVGNVSVEALDDININGSRIAAFNGGNIFVESDQGTINVGSGSSKVNTVTVSFVNPATGKAAYYQESVYGSGIVANTLAPTTGGQTIPPNAAARPGNITMLAPQGDIVADTGGILQVALDGSFAPGPTVALFAGTPANFNDDWFSDNNDWNAKPPLYVGNIDLKNSGVIGGTVILKATGNLNAGNLVSRQNSTVTAGQNFTGLLLSGGSANVSGGTVSGTIIGVGGANVAGGSVTASVLGQNVSVNGGAAQSTLGSSATATASTQSAAQQASQAATQQVASDIGGNDDEKKEKNKEGLVRTVGRVTVILPKSS